MGDEDCSSAGAGGQAVLLHSLGPGHAPLCFKYFFVRAGPGWHGRKGVGVRPKEPREAAPIEAPIETPYFARGADERRCHPCVPGEAGQEEEAQGADSIRHRRIFHLSCHHTRLSSNAQIQQEEVHSTSPGRVHPTLVHSALVRGCSEENTSADAHPPPTTSRPPPPPHLPLCREEPPRSFPRPGPLL